jgi:hypothetical protein
LVKPLIDDRLGGGFLRTTTSLPEGHERFVSELKQMLRSS